MFPKCSRKLYIKTNEGKFRIKNAVPQADQLAHRVKWDFMEVRSVQIDPSPAPVYQRLSRFGGANVP